MKCGNMGKPKTCSWQIEDLDSSSKEDHIAEIYRIINLEIIRNECLEELEELRRNENQPQGQ